jgi:hypothetical protein
MTLQLLHSEFPYIYEENLIFFFFSEYSNNTFLLQMNSFIAIFLLITTGLFMAKSKTYLVETGGGMHRLFWAQMALASLVAISGPTPSNAPRNDVAPLKTITYRAI